MFFHNLSELDYFFIRLSASYFVFINSYIIFTKSQNINTSKYRTVLVFVINIFISVVYALTNYSVALAQTISFFGIALTFTVIANTCISKTIMVSLISISFAHAIKMLSTIITALIMWILQAPINTSIPDFCGDIISLIFTILLLKNRRFRKGISFFEKEEKLGLGMVITGMVYLLLTVNYNSNQISVPLLTIMIITFSISGFGIYLWVRRGITKHYRERLQLKSEEHYQELLKEKELENEKLSQSNEFLAKVVHRDNHLMSALSNSINAYFDSNGKQLDDDLLREIQTLAKERGELIEREQRASKLLPSTGNLVIDGAVNDLYIKAAAHGIDFNLTVSETVDAIIGKYISQIDLQTLLCDHIKDAIIAVDAAENDKGKILVDFSVKNENYQITVFDSGVDFEIDTLAKLGKERVTTHADNGGSGIGFMTTFGTLRKAYASLMITEFAHKTPFSKSVSIIFDGENSFIIQSYRSDILKTAINRDDVVII